MEKNAGDVQTSRLERTTRDLIGLGVTASGGRSAGFQRMRANGRSAAARWWWWQQRCEVNSSRRAMRSPAFLFLSSTRVIVVLSCAWPITPHCLASLRSFASYALLLLPTTTSCTDASATIAGGGNVLNHSGGGRRCCYSSLSRIHAEVEGLN